MKGFRQTNTTGKKIKTRDIAAPSHMFSLIEARIKIKEQVICSLYEIAFLLQGMEAKLIKLR